MIDGSWPTLAGRVGSVGFLRIGLGECGASPIGTLLAKYFENDDLRLD